jgi:hypothetical protein
LNGEIDATGLRSEPRRLGVDQDTIGLSVQYRYDFLDREQVGVFLTHGEQIRFIWSDRRVAMASVATTVRKFMLIASTTLARTSYYGNNQCVGAPAGQDASEVRPEKG